MSELLIGFDDSAESHDAVALGGQLAEALELTPLLVNVIAMPEWVLTSHEAMDQLKAEAQEELAVPLEALSQFEPSAEVVPGRSAAQALHDLADRRSAGAIVVGSSHRGPVGSLMMGSTAERLLHGAPCAVAVAARGYAEAETRPLRLAVAYDGSAEADLGLSAGVNLAERCNSTLTLLAVTRETGVTPTPLSASMPAAAERETREEKRVRSVLDGARGRVPAELPVHDQILRGSAGRALVDVSEDFDLMLTGSRGYGPVRTTLIGSTSRHLLSESRCSVMALPRPADADATETMPAAAQPN